MAKYLLKINGLLLHNYLTISWLKKYTIKWTYGNLVFVIFWSPKPCTHTNGRKATKTSTIIKENFLSSF
jgi:hypothetical protein